MFISLLIHLTNRLLITYFVSGTVLNSGTHRTSVKLNVYSHLGSTMLGTVGIWR